MIGIRGRCERERRPSFISQGKLRVETARRRRLNVSVWMVGLLGRRLFFRALGPSLFALGHHAHIREQLFDLHDGDGTTLPHPPLLLVITS